MMSSQYTPFLPGLILCVLLAYFASSLSEVLFFQQVGLSALIVAILLGMIIGNTVYNSKASLLGPGVHLVKHHLLRLGIILYGFRLTLEDITHVGLEGLLCDVAVIGSTLCIALFVGIKLFKLKPESVILIGAGSSICGAAAVMATDGVIDAEAEQVSVAVSTVVVFGSIGIFLYPYLYQLNLDWHWIGVDAQAFGIYVGSTIHEVAQVVAAGQSINPNVSDVAVITKMVRVMMLAPLLVMLSLFYRNKREVDSSGITNKSAIVLPWFAFLFIALVLFNSMHLLPVQWVHYLVQADTLILAMAMAGLGLTTHLSAVRKAGVTPLLLAFILFGWLVVGGALINRIVFNYV